MIYHTHAHGTVKGKHTEQYFKCPEGILTVIYKNTYCNKCFLCQHVCCPKGPYREINVHLNETKEKTVRFFAIVFIVTLTVRH